MGAIMKLVINDTFGREHTCTVVTEGSDHVSVLLQSYERETGKGCVEKGLLIGRDHFISEMKKFIAECEQDGDL